MEQGWSPLAEQREASQDEWAVLKAGCVNGGVFDEREHKALSQEVTPLPELEIREGDLLVSRANTRELLGSAAVVSSVRPRLLLCDKLYRLTLECGRLEPRFLALLLAAHPTRYQLEVDAVGASNSMQNITQETIRNLLLALPPLETQMQIVAMTEELGRKLDSLVARIRSAIDRLTEFRTALISAAVTGKIDVRESA
jgi:type I restriction enzyme S subunit